MTYIISKYKKEELEKIKPEWEMLEQGPEMTYFQSYDWNNMLTHLTPEGKAYEAIYYLVKDESGKAVLIAPLWIIKSTFRLINKKGAYFIGRKGWSDYLNLVYDTFLPAAFECLVSTLKDEYKLSSCHFEELKETSSLYQYITSHYQVTKDRITPCVHLAVPNSIEAYHKILSKNTRQNIRTAQNRLKKDGLCISYSFDDHPDLAVCEQLHTVKVRKKAAKRNRYHSLLAPVKRFFAFRKRLRVSFPTYLLWDEDKQSRFLAAYINDELSAFFNYGYDRNHQEIVVMAACVNEKYAKYSPGILLCYEYILHQIAAKEVKIVDFTRGDEKYKFTLGGVSHVNHTIAFSI